MLLTRPKNELRSETSIKCNITLSHKQRRGRRRSFTVCYRLCSCMWFWFTGRSSQSRFVQVHSGAGCGGRVLTTWKKTRDTAVKSLCLHSISTVVNMAEYKHINAVWFIFVPEVWGHVAHCGPFCTSSPAPDTSPSASPCPSAPSESLPCRLPPETRKHDIMFLRKSPSLLSSQ